MFTIPPDLKPGHILGFAGEAIVRWETDGAAGHVGVYVGDGMVLTSLTGTGVGIYPLAANGTLIWVREPDTAPDVPAGLAAIKPLIGVPYGWCDDIGDIGLPNSGKGINCSHITAVALEAMGTPQFDPTFNKAKITPAHFETSYESKQVWPVMS